MQPSQNDGDLSWREEQMQQAHLLLLRGENDEAMRLIQTLRAGAPREDELEELYARAVAATSAREEVSRERRALRWTLGLNTSWKRACWWLSSIGLIGWGAFALAQALVVCQEKGMHAMITVSYHTGRYGMGPLVTYTEEAWLQLIWPAGAIVLGIIGVIVVIIAARGAEAWEDLDSSDNVSSRSNWLWP